MRIAVLLAFIILTTTLKAQTFMRGDFISSGYRGGFANTRYPADSSSSQKKWLLTRYGALSTTFSFFKGGQAMIVAAPFAVQLNRRLSNNLYAFANATIAPAYVSFNRSFIASDFNKAIRSNGLFKSSNLDMYSSASLGLQYVNDEKTFSISGSIGVERSSYPLLPYYRTNEQRPAYPGALNR